MLHTRQLLRIVLLLGVSLYACEDDGPNENDSTRDAGRMGQQQTPSTTAPTDAGGAASLDAAAPSSPAEQDAASAPATLDSATATPKSDAGSGGSQSDAATPVDASTNEAGSVVEPRGGLPPITDPAAAGPFMVDIVQTAPGLSSHMLYVPRELGKDGIKHPIVVWTNGNGASSSYYDAFLRHIASHGFFLVVDKRSTSMRETEYAEQKQGIDWAAEQAASTSGTYAGKLDGNRIGIMGHSMGSLSSFVNGGDPRVRTTIHWSGGLIGNPTGTDEGALQKLHAPAAFLCGGADTTAGPACANDFRDAPPKLPVFYGTLAGVSHLGVFGDRNGGEYGRMGVAWLRWKLAGDETFRSWFAGPSCKACEKPWTGMSRNLE